MNRLNASCILCNQHHRSPYAICLDCLGVLPRLNTTCPNCAHPIPEPSPYPCAACIKSPPAYNRVYVAYRYDEPLRTLIHHFKYNSDLSLAHVLGHLMLESLPNPGSQCLLPVPLHRKRLNARAFNQAAVLAKQLSRQTGMPYHHHWAKKLKHTPPQASLHKQDRQKSLSKVFRVKALPYHHVTIIDDIVTTGSTVHHLAQSLKAQGVATVDVWCCARTVLK